MFAAFSEHPEFRRRYAIICAASGQDVLQRLAGGDRAALDENMLSSLMTVLISSLSLDEYFRRGGRRPDFVAGYSVGQWTAMYAAEMFSFETLVALLVKRARFMDECVSRAPGAMLGVIGVAQDTLEQFCEELHASGLRLFISNYNCFGQYTIAGDPQAIELAEERLRVLKAKKTVRLPVSGAWHCPLLDSAQERFAQELSTLQCARARIPVVDNVTGEWLPEEAHALRAQLARHITHPVRWADGIRHLIRAGAGRFVEIGFGKTLTKFGFFIDRQMECATFYT
jgi:[acyl-carrier-protein] S-malonyltransferase